MIVDVHYHFMRLPADDSAARQMVSHLLNDARRAGYSRPVDEVMPAYRDMMNDPDCDKLVRRMDENGIDVTVINVVDNVDYGWPDDRVLRINEACARAAAKHPGRLLSLAGIDPRRPDAPALLRRCLTDFKMNGLKWHPDNGFYPNSKEAYAVLQVLNEFGLPLLTHCSPLPGSKARFAQPIHLDDIAGDFPNLQIIAAHMGHLWWHDWAALAQFKQNINGDLAMWQITALARPAIFRRYLREIIDNIGPDQILWSSDGPVFEPLVSNKEFIRTMHDLTREQFGIGFTEDEVHAMLGGNAARIFKLESREMPAT
jgi:hypothetical protein